MSSLQSLIQCGTKLWLDSIDPDLLQRELKRGATGATSNPVIISQLIQSGRFDQRLRQLTESGLDVDAAAWRLTDQLVAEAQQSLHDTWQRTGGNDGYVSFELDPLLEDPEADLPRAERVRKYIELGRHYSQGHDNRLIKVPATPAGIESLEELAAAGVCLNVTLIFTGRQYEAARDAIWRGAQRLSSRDRFKSVYSIFVSRIDVYAAEHLSLSPPAAAELGTVNAKQIWADNREFWSQRPTPLDQEIVFASTGVKRPDWKPWKYVAALAGSDIQTNPPATNEAADDSGVSFTRQVDQLPAREILDEIAEVDFQRLEEVLMKEGIEKFAGPQKQLLELVGQ